MKYAIMMAIDAVIWAGVYYGFIVGNEYAGNLTLFVMWVAGVVSVAAAIVVIFSDAETKRKTGKEFLKIPMLPQFIGRASAFCRFMVMGMLGFYSIAFVLCAAFMFGILAKSICVDELKRPGI